MSMGLFCWWLSFTNMINSFKADRFIQTVFKQLLFATLSCTFAFVGAVVGCLTGAAIGQTTETGFLRGSGIGTISGSLVALELAESLLNHNNFLSKVGISTGPVDGDVFITDWITQFLLKSYDFQVSNLLHQSVMSDLSDIFDVEMKGLSLELITNLPTFMVASRLKYQCDDADGVSCPICLEELREGECGRKLSGCGHEYHLHCIDTWLVRRGCCPVCRQEIIAA